MAIDMSTVTSITLDNQDVTKIEDSLGNVLWQKNITPTTEVIDKFPDATNDILMYDGGPISDYTTIIRPNDFSYVQNEHPTTIDGETYPRALYIVGDSATTENRTSFQINVATNSTVYLICASSISTLARNIFIDDISTSYVTQAAAKVALPMTSGVHTIGFSGNARVWGIIGDLNVQNNN